MKRVALFTRAWIEIDGQRHVDCHRRVALFTRAWIEIRLCLTATIAQKVSPSLRGRGLKSEYELTQKMIEKSPSLRGRGLK